MNLVLGRFQTAGFDRRMTVTRSAWVIKTCAAAVLIAVLAMIDQPALAEAPAPREATRPLIRDFMGLNVHTVQFKPALYAPVCRLLRDYHPMEWDVGKDTSHPTTFPMAINRVDWGALYGVWTKAGYDVDACLMFDPLASEKWKDPSADARAYGEAFARFFGPTNGRGWVSSAEVGNEPSKYTDAQYRVIFEAMARGLRAGDPKLKIATCAVMTGKPDQWSKPLTAIEGLESCYDVLNVHSYPFKDKWPTWRRSYPEDPSIRFVKDINDVIGWRDAHAAGKQVWLTEFGYDSATKPPASDGPWKQWVGVTDEQQAQYIVRAFLTLSATQLDRAYLYFFNDQDEPQLHGASGITRNFQPKPSYYAMAQLYKNLGEFRYVRAIVRSDGDLYCFEYQKPAGDSKAAERVFVAWSPTGATEDEPRKKLLPIAHGADIYRAQKMAPTSDNPQPLEWKVSGGGVEVEVGQSPVYLWAH